MVMVREKRKGQGWEKGAMIKGGIMDKGVERVRAMGVKKEKS